MKASEEKLFFLAGILEKVNTLLTAVTQQKVKRYVCVQHESWNLTFSILISATFMCS